MIISKFINNLLILITMLAFIAQFFIDFSTINIAASMIILLSAFFCIFYIRWSSALETHPLSSFAILGFSFTTTLGALWAQSLAGTPVAENLRQPIETLSWLTLFQVIAIVAHIFYRLKANSSTTQQVGMLRGLFDRMGLYDTPTPSVLWTIGVLGVFCLLFSHVFPVANGLSYLAWAPFLIPVFYDQEGKNYCNIRIAIYFLALHSAVIILLAMFFNARGILFLGFVTVILVFILNLMRSRKRLTSTLLLRLVIVFLVTTAIVIPASDLITAMGIARTDRGKISPIKMISNTIEIFNTPEKLQVYREQEIQQAQHTISSEFYVANPLMGRFVNTQRHDSQIYFASLINDRSSNEVLRKSVDFLWGALPQPFLDALKIDIDKRYLLLSMGDVISHYAVGTPLGGLRTGSVFAQGLVLFGNLSILIYFALCFILFASIDIFSKRGPDGMIVISVIGMLNLWPNFIYGITADSFHHLFIAVVRGVLQSALLYFIAVSFAKAIGNAFSLKDKSKRTAVFKQNR